MNDNVWTIEIAITEGDEGFGWRVDCDGCEFTEKMLSEEGAQSTAREHQADHVIIVTYAKEAKR